MINFRNHIFKTLVPVTAILCGLGIFGLLFGFIGGIFIDQLIINYRRKNNLKDFFINPENKDRTEKLQNNPEKHKLTAAAAAAIIRKECSGDPARIEILAAAFPQIFPEAEQHCIETLLETNNIDYAALSVFFNRTASEEQKRRMKLLSDTCVIFQPDKASTDEDYAVLGLSPDSSKTEVRKIYLKLAAQFHPDKADGLSDEQKKISEDAFKRIAESYGRIISQQ